jgi:hypothetical protein
LTDEIGGRPHPGDADRRPRSLPRHRPGDPLSSHQPFDALAPDVDPSLTKSGMDAAGAVGASALAVDPRDPLEQPRVSKRPIRRRPPLPGVEARAGDAEQPAHQRDRVVGLLRRDEPKQAHRVSLSFADRQLTPAAADVTLKAGHQVCSAEFMLSRR